MTDNLIKFRHEQNKNIVQFARSIGVSRDVYYKIESGERTPSYKFLCKFVKAYPDANIIDIFFNEKLDKMSN